MRKQLFLIRHSEANETFPGQKDIDRTLTEGGSVRAMQLANYFHQQGVVPDAIITSNAERALSTSGYLGEKLLADHQAVQTSDDVYESSVRIMVGLINQLPAGKNIVMLVGHMPILQYVAEYLCGDSLDFLEPGGFYELIIEDSEWEAIGQGSMQLNKVVQPAEYAIV